MKHYQALGGDAGVTAYRSLAKSIEIEFRDRSVYLYTYASAGKDKVEAMKMLASKGAGLTTYINQHVRENYAKRTR